MAKTGTARCAPTTAGAVPFAVGEASKSGRTHRCVPTKTKNLSLPGAGIIGGIRRTSLALLILLVIAGCAPREPEIPTRAALPTAAELPTIPPTRTPAPIAPSSSIPPTDAIPNEIAAVPSIPVLIGSLDLTNAPGIPLRRAPSADAETVVTIPGGTIAHAQARSLDGDWYEIVTDQGAVGWVAAPNVFAGQDVASIPLKSAPTLIAAAPGILPTWTPSPEPITSPTAVTPGDIPAMERRLRETPILLNLTSERTGWIFERGRDFGLRADVFTTIGDSNTTNGDFLQPFGMGADTYCRWGDYDSLHATVAYFSTALPDEAVNSFVHHSETAQKGFSSASVLDPFWAGGVCRGSESPLACEYRTIQPSVAIIMLGGIDVNDLTTADYAANMRTIVQTSIQKGVIPVLTTFVVAPDRGGVYERSLEFNLALLDIANIEGTPLINLWAAAQALPDDGIGPDHTHLKAQVGSYCAFDGAQAQLGGTLRNLLTLQALDQLRANVLTR